MSNDEQQSKYSITEKQPQTTSRLPVVRVRLQFCTDQNSGSPFNFEKLYALESAKTTKKHKQFYESEIRTNSTSKTQTRTQRHSKTFQILSSIQLIILPRNHAKISMHAMLVASLTKLPFYFYTLLLTDSPSWYFRLWAGKKALQKVINVKIKAKPQTMRNAYTVWKFTFCLMCACVCVWRSVWVDGVEHSPNPYRNNRSRTPLQMETIVCSLIFFCFSLKIIHSQP